MIGLLKRTAKCRGCGKDIAFIKTISGKCIPVDTEPIQFIPEEAYDKFVMMDGTVQRGQAHEGDELDAERFMIGYRSHFATCPAADQFRKKKTKSERVKEWSG